MPALSNTTNPRSTTKVDKTSRVVLRYTYSSIENNQLYLLDYIILLTSSSSPSWVRSGQSIVRDWPNYFVLKRVNHSQKRNLLNVGVEGTEGVDVSSLTGPVVNTSVLFFFPSLEATFFALTTL